MVSLSLQMTALNGLPDPCPRPETLRRKALNDKQRLLYAPMADLGGLVYDKDAVYIDIPDWKVPPFRLLSPLALSTQAYCGQHSGNASHTPVHVLQPGSQAALSTFGSQAMMHALQGAQPSDRITDR